MILYNIIILYYYFINNICIAVIPQPMLHISIFSAVCLALNALSIAFYMVRGLHSD